MTNEERRELLDFIREQASLIEGKLPPTAEIPDRNAYAHMFKLIKTTLGLSYKECCTNEIPTIKALVSGEATKWLAIDNSE